MASTSDCVLEISGPEGPMQGQVVLPSDWNHNFVVMIPGSGPTNRDGNSPPRVMASTLSLLAAELAGLGVGTLRIDKRGLFGSARAISNPDNVTLREYANDASLWVKEIDRLYGGTRIWLLGHSEGGLVALCSEPADTLVKGLILIATPGRRLGVILREQLTRCIKDEHLLRQVFEAIASLERRQRVEAGDVPMGLEALLRPSVQGYLIDMLSIDPSACARRFQKPILILQGLEDLQVNTADAQALAAEARLATLRCFPGINHVLKAVPFGDETANISSYSNPDMPLGPGIVQSISDFIHASGS